MRFYIGSKTECKFLDVNEVPTIYNMKTNQPYFGSSTNFQFKQDFTDGHIFSAEVLEVVVRREDLRDRENYHIQSHNAVNSNEYYNMSHAFIHSHSFTAVRNVYGETVAEFAAAQSQTSKRDGTALAAGHKNFGEMYFYMFDELQKGVPVEVLSKQFGKHRKWATTTLKPYDMKKAQVDLGRATQEQVREFLINGASLKLAATRLGIELPAARVLMGDFYKENERSFSVAVNRGKSKEELEKEITFRILDGEGFIEIGNSMTLCRESILRYFLRCLRANKESIKEILEKP